VPPVWLAVLASTDASRKQLRPPGLHDRSVLQDVSRPCHDGDMSRVASLLDKAVYGMAQVDYVLGLTSGTARRWIDGYARGGRSYPPVVRESSTGSEVVTWGEFVETRLLAEYRDAGVALVRMRPAVQRLRDELQTAYPLASSQTWIEPEGRELVRRVQEEVSLDRRLSLVVVRTDQRMLEWSTEAREFVRSTEWEETPHGPEVRRLRPSADIAEVSLDPLVSFGEPTVRGVRTEIIAELVRAGETPDGIAEMYELPRSTVDAAVRYELMRAS
jgi:uncharacterized protein (DUF433 family)